MVLEAVAAAVLGVVGAWLVLQPLARPAARRTAAPEPEDPEETRRGIALAALKEIEFDRETGKLSEADYQYLKSKYTRQALEALREDSDSASSAEPGTEDVEAMIAARVCSLRSVGARTSSGAPACATCGPCPEPDALFCSSCGHQVA